VFFPSIYDIRITHIVSFVNDSCYTVRKNDDTCLEGSVVLVWLAVCYFMRPVKYAVIYDICNLHFIN
jgi:hypothetical protein